MKIRIYSIKNIESLKFVYSNLEGETNQIFFPTFLLSIEELSTELVEHFKKFLQSQIQLKLIIRNDRVLVFGDLNSFKILSANLTNSHLSEIGISIDEILSKYKSACEYRYTFRNKILSYDETYLMGILNLTKDSFYDGNKYFKYENAKKHLDEIIENGADITDIGAESTRPGAEPIDPDLEFSILEPVLDYLKTKDVIVSVDTYKSKVV
ncbi:MAG: dihydropteroate synthase, partial [Ignavibacteria bacterium]|nr:dihydropteroate synthase [Ignavibacteria bacterium]